MTHAAENFSDPRILLAEESKEELIDEILKLRHEKQNWEQEKQKLEKQLEELKKQINKPAFIKIPVYKPKKRWKKLGRPVGHPGCTRRKPEVIDHIVEQKLEKCPDCGQETLSWLPTETEEHIQEDIVPARVEATKFIRRVFTGAASARSRRQPLTRLKKCRMDIWGRMFWCRRYL